MGIIGYVLGLYWGLHAYRLGVLHAGIGSEFRHGSFFLRLPCAFQLLHLLGFSCGRSLEMFVESLVPRYYLHSTPMATVFSTEARSGYRFRMAFAQDDSMLLGGPQAYPWYSWSYSILKAWAQYKASWMHVVTGSRIAA